MTSKEKIFFAGILVLFLVIITVHEVITNQRKGIYVKTIQYNYRNYNGVVYSKYFLNTGETIIDTEKKYFVYENVK